MKIYFCNVLFHITILRLQLHLLSHFSVFNQKSIFLVNNYVHNNFIFGVRFVTKRIFAGRKPGCVL